MDSSTVFLVIAGLLLILLVGLSYKSGKPKKLKVFLADNTTIDVTRKWGDSWNDQKDMKVYHQDAKRIWLANHWVIKVEEM